MLLFFKKNKTILFLFIAIFFTLKVGAVNENVIDSRINNIQYISSDELVDSIRDIIYDLQQCEPNYREWRINEILNGLPKDAVDTRVVVLHSIAAFSQKNKVQLFTNAYEYARKHNRTDYFFDNYIALANCYYFEQLYDSSLVYILKARDIMSSEKIISQVQVYLVLANVYYGIQLYDLAEYYYRKILEIFDNPKPRQEWILRTVANDLGLIEMKRGKYDYALDNFTEGRKRLEGKLNSYSDSLAWCYYNLTIAKCMYSLNFDSDTALNYLRFSYCFSKIHQIDSYLELSYQWLIKFYIRNDNPDSVMKYNTEYGAYFNSLDKLSLEDRAGYAQVQAEVSEYFNNTSEALLYYKQYRQIIDSVNAHLKAASVVEMLTEQEYEKLENEYEHTHNQLIFLLGFVFVILFLIAYLYVYSRRTIRLNKKLEETNRTKDKLFSIISHDLRSPFNVIYGFSEMIQDAIETNDTARIEEYGEIIHNHSADLVHWVDNLLYWSRSQQNGVCVS